MVNGKKRASGSSIAPGSLFVEADLPEADEYRIDIQAGPTWAVPTDDRTFTVNLSMIRLVPAD